MKQVARLSRARNVVPGQDKQVSEKTSESAFRGFRRFFASASLRRVCAFAVALSPACDSLWFSYLEPCDSSRTACQDSAGDRILPSNGIDPAWFGDAKAALEPTQDLVIDTDLGTVVTLAGNQQLTDVSYHQVNAADCGKSWKVGIGVFSFKRIRIPEGVRVRFAGTRAAALLSPGRIEIEGLLDLRGSQAECSDMRCGGPGGFPGGYAQNPGVPGDGPGGGLFGHGVGGDGDEAGGGGAGSCGTGGRGGDGNTPALYPGGAGGQPYQNANLIPLCGGSGGGPGGLGKQTTDLTQRGGGGGGAIQIVSKSAVTIGSSAATPSGIQAGGGGGQSDHGTNFNDGGGGGGAGGAILIEAPIITISSGAVLAANGGSGGGGYNNGKDTANGVPADLSSTPVLGGLGEVRSGGSGGAGSAQNGSDATGAPGDGGGGGGGAVGRIRLNTQDGTATISGVLSPNMGNCTTLGVLTLR